MSDPVQRALDAIADGTPVDWLALDAACSDQETLDRLRVLAEIARVAQVHAGAPTTALPLPCRWGFLEVRERIGHGAHGTVYRAIASRLDREVALKVLRDDDSGRPWSLAMEEGRLLARVRHQNVVAIHGADRIDGRTGLWMELLVGDTLREHVEREGPMSARETSRIGVELCAGLRAIHAAGLLHRDIKPQNVVLSQDGRTVLTDLGAAHQTGGDDGSLEGTPAYLAPEILKGSRASAASEVYALGVLLFFTATGVLPFDGESVADLRQSHESPRQWPARFRMLPPAFRAVLERALAANPANRFGSIEEFGRALQRLDRARSLPMTAWAIAAFTIVVAAAAAPAFLARSTHDRTPGSLQAADGREQSGTRRTVVLPRSDMGMPSRDGRVYPFVDGAGALQLWDVVTAKPRLIVAAPPNAIRSSIASPDGTRVAYAVRLPADHFELRTIGADATWPRVLIPDESAYEPVPLDWSRDGKLLLLWLEQRDGSEDLVVHSIPDGRTSVLLTRRGHVQSGASLSPDGQRAVVADDAARGAPLQMLDLRRRSTPLAGTDGGVSPEWLLDGRIFFLRRSKSAVSRDGWVVGVTDRGERNAPVLAVPNVGVSIDVASEVRVSDAGELQAIRTTFSADVYVTSISLARDGASIPPTRISPDEIGNHVGPSWSPDGRRLAYFTTHPSSASNGTPLRTLTVRDIRSGTVRELRLPLSFVGGYSPRWCPEGNSVVILGRAGRPPDPVAYFRVNVNDGKTSTLVPVPADADPPSAECVGNDTLLYTDPGRGIVARNLLSGTERVRVRLERGTHVAHFASSPDRKSIAFAAIVEGPQRWRAELTIQRVDGTRRVLDAVAAPEDVAFQAWTPDGRTILYTKGRSNGPHTLWRVPSAGGRPQPLRFTLRPAPNPLSLHPDGHTLAYPERVVMPELSIIPVAVLAHSRR